MRLLFAAIFSLVGFAAPSLADESAAKSNEVSADEFVEFVRSGNMQALDAFLEHVPTPRKQQIILRLANNFDGYVELLRSELNEKVAEIPERGIGVEFHFGALPLDEERKTVAIGATVHRAETQSVAEGQLCPGDDLVAIGDTDLPRVVMENDPVKVDAAVTQYIDLTLSRIRSTKEDTVAVEVYRNGEFKRLKPTFLPLREGTKIAAAQVIGHVEGLAPQMHSLANEVAAIDRNDDQATNDAARKIAGIYRDLIVFFEDSAKEDRLPFCNK